MNRREGNDAVTLHLEFDPAKHPDRDAAIRSFREPLKMMAARGDWPHGNPQHVVFLLGELAKNTFDHSEGVGLLDVTPGEITYIDSGKPFDWAYWSKEGRSSKPAGGVNAGLGLAHLFAEAQTGYELRVRRTAAGTEFKFVACGALTRGN